MDGATANGPVDPVAQIRSREYRRLLVFAALIGIIVSAASWVFLELVYAIQHGVYEKLPETLGYDEMPTWWPLPVLLVAGVVAAYAIVRLPGNGGHVPYEGLQAGGATDPRSLPGILLAAFATLGLGLVLGPEGPLIAASTGLAVLAVSRAKRDTPQQAVAVLAAAAAFAAISSVFGSPIIGTVVLVEAAGLGGPMLPLVLLPGLMSAGIGSIIFLGLGHWSGLDRSHYALAPVQLAPMGTPTVAELLWAVVLAIVAAGVCAAVVSGARASAKVTSRSPFLLLPAAALVVGLLAIAFGQITGESEMAVLFSGQDALDGLFASADTLSVGTLLVLLVCKAAAWSLSLGSFRGGPTFPALFVGAVGGLLAGSLPGLSSTAAVVILLGAMSVSILRLPLSAVVLTLLLTSSAGTPDTAPLAIIAVVAAYVATLAIRGWIEHRAAEPLITIQSPPPA